MPNILSGCTLFQFMDVENLLHYEPNDEISSSNLDCPNFYDNALDAQNYYNGRQGCQRICEVTGKKYVGFTEIIFFV